MIDAQNLGRLAAILHALGQESPNLEISCLIAYPISDPKRDEVIGLIWDGEEFLDYLYDPDPESTEEDQPTDDTSETHPPGEKK